MASLLTEEQVAEFKEAFEEIDVDGKGTITMGKLLEKLEEEYGEDGKDMSPEIMVIVSMADTNGDGMINFEEFLEMMVKG